MPSSFFAIGIPTDCIFWQRNEYTMDDPGIWRYELCDGEPRLVIVQEPIVLHDTLTGAVLGDPLPGRSALDRLPSPAIVPAQEPGCLRHRRKGPRVLSPREKRRARVMAALAKVEP